MRVVLAFLMLWCLLLVGGAGAQEYTVGPGDTLDVRVYEEEDLNRVVRVAEDGTVTLPLVGRFQVSGQTVTTINDVITKRLAADFLVNPQVTVNIVGFHSQRVEVLGAVKSPGVIFLTGSSDLINILAQAGGLLEGSGRYVVLTRAGTNPTDAGFQTERVDLHALLDEGRSELNVPVRAGDRLFVPKSNEIYVMGEVNKQGAVPFESDMSLLQAISKAGGFLNTAATSRVQIIRVVDGKEQVLRVDVKRIQEGDGRDVPLLAEDIVTVPKSIF